MTRLARALDGTPLLGDEEGFVPLSSVDPSLESVEEALPLAAAGTLPDPSSAPAERVSPENASFGSPLAEYGKLWGIGLNYADHAADLDEDRPTEPASFMKPSSAATGPGGPIRLPPREVTDRVTAEAELAVVVGRTCSNVSRDEVDDVVAGYVPVIDMTAEDILGRNPRFLTRAKSFDSFLVVGPWIVTPEAATPLDEVTVQTVVNDSVVASNQIRNMMTRPDELVSFHSQVMTLEPGDVISTGTPGAEPIEPGDSVTATVESVGSVDADVVR
jgi:2-keto-4-pentenoate hydratase/2-oxohepta-3-ene-1,7-dioic acid hydratase in catechol pathway